MGPARSDNSSRLIHAPHSSTQKTPPSGVSQKVAPPHPHAHSGVALGWLLGMGGPSVPGRGRLTDAGLAPRERLGLPQRPASKGEPDRLPVESLPRRESQESDRSLHVRGAPPGGDKPWTLERRAHEFHTPLQHTRGRQLALPRNPDCIMVGTTGRPSQSVHETSVRLDPRRGRTLLVGRM